MVSVHEIVGLIEGVANDSTVPKNIRRALDEAKARLTSNDEVTLKVSSAIYSLESVSEDVNMPSHARMQIWNILSALESMKK
ncbi:MAG: UPF0147 family protein [Candidatus Micrarchaeota archaeon]|nr:UPF0147 family protein [Candidatus Micrarchaeota archaeon]